MLKQSKCCFCGCKITVSSQIEHGSYNILAAGKVVSVCHSCFNNVIQFLAERPDETLVHEQIDILA